MKPTHGMILVKLRVMPFFLVLLSEHVKFPHSIFRCSRICSALLETLVGGDDERFREKVGL